uniref:Cytochrome b n=1 Tax=Diplonema ambulator TaxID=182243 RepID=A0A2D2AJS2_9EUGL|nr:apocytochrome b [Diplonema ambulator]
MGVAWALDVGGQLHATICTYSTHANLSTAYNMGAAAGIMLAVQIASGVLIAMSYVASDAEAFSALDSALRDTTYGWCLRSTHSNYASAVFLFMYLHAARAWMYGSTTRVHAAVWVLGLVAWLLMMGIAFLGYVLPWGLMSYWALTVITNLLTVLPIVGVDVLCYCWGGYFITTVTVQRMFTIHYLLPFVVLAVVVAHLVCLHYMGSASTSTSPGTAVDSDAFLLYYYKDMYVLGCCCALTACVVIMYPDTLHHPDNYCYVDRYVTPKHIVPEWYFLPFYSMLRACSIKALGVALLGCAIIAYALLCLVPAAYSYSRGIHTYTDAAMHISILCILGLLGQCAPIYPYVDMSGALTVMATAIHIML